MPFTREELAEIVSCVPPEPLPVAVADGAESIVRAIASAMASASDKAALSGEAQARMIRAAVAELSASIPKAMAEVCKAMPDSSRESVNLLSEMLPVALAKAAEVLAKAALAASKAMAADLVAAIPKAGAYAFEIQRGEDGLIDSVVARPL